MATYCPYCQHGLELKGAKPGRYASKCPKCAKKLQVVIADDPATAPAVTGIHPEPENQETQFVGDTKAASGVGASRASGLRTAPASSRIAPTEPGVGETMPQQTVPARGAVGATREARGPASMGATVDHGSDNVGFETGPVSGSETSKPSGETPATLGGYQILQELGRGGMGAVYLAKQMSLDRNVALKVMRPEWASNPTFVSRFTREAYAAAQLVHHNVVQIYDFGVDKGTNYFSMEFVQGETLSSLVKRQKKLDPEVAVGYVLQASRGLKCAHDQSMIHRDVKPENLLLNSQGVVKVADLGLVKTPAFAEAEAALEPGASLDATARVAPTRSSSGGPITMANVAMGTPAFMAPEQARDAAGVDGRADIYSLGCTLYDLVTGRPPFEGRTAMELISKHTTEAVPPPETIVKRVSKTLSAIILKMVAKRPEDRYSNLDELIAALEDFLGVSSKGPFSPREEHANALSECVESFRASPTARLRRQLILGGAAGLGVLVLLTALLGTALLSGGLIGLGLMTALSYFILTGITRRTHLFSKARELVFSSRPGDWLMTLAGVFLFLTVLVLGHQFWVWVAFSFVAVGIAAGFHFGVDRKVEAERSGSLEKTEAMLRSMRLQGLNEETLREFVCKYGGEDWEEFYESLFGYEAKRVARDRWGRGERGHSRKAFAAWRDPLIAWIDAKQKARRDAREKALLQKIEEKSLEAQGVDLVVARRKARRAAEAMVAMASEMKASSRNPAAQGRPRQAMKAMREAAESPEKVLAGREHGLSLSRDDGPLGTLLGARPRFLVGAGLLAGCLFWMYQNDLLKYSVVKGRGADALAVVSKAAEALDVISHPGKTSPLRVPMLPGPVSRRFNSFLPGVAGLILLLSTLFRGSTIGLIAVGAVVALLGPSLGVPPIGPLNSQTASMALGAAFGVLGIVFGRGRP